MAILEDIKYPGNTHYDNPGSFLSKIDVDELVDYAKSFDFDTQITENAINIIDNSPGLNPNSFIVEERSPLNELSSELLEDMLSSIDILKRLPNAIQNRGYIHIYNEAGKNYLVVLEEYKNRLTELEEAVKAYNQEANTPYEYKAGRGPSGDIIYTKGYYATCSLSYDLISEPTLTFYEGTGPYKGSEDNPQYSGVNIEKESCNEFYNTYVIDAIDIKKKADECKGKNSLFPIDERIDELLYQSFDTSLTEYGIDPTNNEILSIEKKKDKIIVHYNGYDLIYPKNGKNKKATGILYTNNNIYIDISNPDKVNYKRYNPSDGTLKNISIFDKENIASSQYGADQGRFNKENFEKNINDPYIWKQLQKYYPTSSFKSEAEAMEFYQRYFTVIELVGCGYAASANIVFKQFEGREEEFEKTFGYPMYTVKNGEIDYNYEYFMLDYYNDGYAGKYSIEELEKGTEIKNMFKDIIDPEAKNSAAEVHKLNKYLSRVYNIECDSGRDFIHTDDYKNDIEINNWFQNESKKYDYIVYGGSGWDLYNMDGTAFQIDGGCHYMMITEYTDDGRPIVSSWGMKFILDMKDENNQSIKRYWVNF